MDPDPKLGNGNGDDVETPDVEETPVADAGQADAMEEVPAEGEEEKTV